MGSKNNPGKFDCYANHDDLPFHPAPAGQSLLR